MRNVVFRYTRRLSDTTFKIGPIDFTLRSGELVFITGGNGSGKSTFLMLLAVSIRRIPGKSRSTTFVSTTVRATNIGR